MVFLNVEERNKGDTIWKEIPVEKTGGNKLIIKEEIYNMTPGIQNIIIDTSNITLKKLRDKDREISNNNLESLEFENYKAIRGESKSGGYKHSKTIVKKTCK